MKVLEIMFMFKFFIHEFTLVIWNSSLENCQEKPEPVETSSQRFLTRAILFMTRIAREI